jgi:hypothetical protein
VNSSVDNTDIIQVAFRKMITSAPRNCVKLLTHVAIFRKTDAFTSVKHSVFEWHIYCGNSPASVHNAR